MAYIPDRGDAVWINLNPQAGHEQAGRQSTVVLLLKAYNAKLTLPLFCSITCRAASLIRFAQHTAQRAQQ